MLSILIWVISLIVLILGIRGIVLGFQQKNVFYYDIKDLILTEIASFGSLFSIFYFIPLLQHKNIISFLACFLISLFMWWCVIFIPYKYTQNKFDLSCIILGRYLLFIPIIFITFIIIGGLLGGGKSKDLNESIVDDLKSLAIFTVMGYGFYKFMKRLINGKRILNDIANLVEALEIKSCKK